MADQTDTLNVALDSRRYVQGAREMDGANKQITDSTNRAAQAADKLNTKSEQAGRQLRDKYGRFVKGAKQDTDRFGDAMNKASSHASRMRSVLVGLFGAFSAAVAIRQTVSILAEFETTMDTVQAVARATDEQMVSLIETAREMGAVTKFSANEAGQGLLFLSRAGFDADEAMAALPSTLSLAAAGAIELGEAADIASNVLAQFQLQAEEMNRVADVLIHTANSANTDVRQLAEALKFAGPVAGALGVSLEETAASIGALGNAGIQASMAGTNMRGVMLSLLSPTSEGQKAIESLGLTVEDVSPEVFTLAEIFDKLRDAQLSATEANAIFGRRNVGAALILRDNSDAVRELTEEYDRMVGTADEVAAAMADNIAGAGKELISVLQEITLQAGDAGVSGVLKNSLTLLTDALRLLAGVDTQLRHTEFLVYSLAGAIKAVTIATTAFIATRIVFFISSMTAATWKAVAAQRALNTAMKANVIGLVVGLLAAAISSFIDFNSILDDGTEEISAYEQAMKDLATTIEGAEEAQLRLNRAIEIGSVSGQRSALMSQAHMLEEASLELRKQLDQANKDLADRIANLEGRGISPSLFNLRPDEQAIIPRSKIEALIRQFNLEEEDVGGALSNATMFQNLRSGNELPAGIPIIDVIDRVEERIRILNLQAEELKNTVGSSGDTAGGSGGTLAGSWNALKTVFGPAISNMVASTQATDEETQAIKDQVDEIDRILAARRKEIELMKERQREASNEAWSRYNSLSSRTYNAGETANMLKQGYSMEEAQSILAQRGKRQEYVDLLENSGISSSAAQARLEMYDQEAEAAQRAEQYTNDLSDALQENAEKAQRLYQTLEDGFADVVVSLTSGIKDAEDALARFGQALLDLSIRQGFLQPAASMFASFGTAALGGLFGVQSTADVAASVPVPGSAHGDVFNGPLMFSVGGSMREMSERGRPEAVVPLERTSSGDLGVNIAGVGGRNVTVIQNITTPDVVGMRKSRKQIANDAKRGFS